MEVKKMGKDAKVEHWIRTLFKHTKGCQWRLTVSVLCAIISVFGGLVPYYGVYKIVVLLVGKTNDITEIVPWIIWSLAGYFVQVFFHMVSTTLSHQSAYTLLCNIRNKLTDGLMGAPLGTVLNEKTGKLKSVIVDRVESIEIPIAHLIPEGLSNLILTLSVIAFIIVIDFRMALALSISSVIAIIIISITLNGYKEKYQNAMQTSDHVNSVIVEYSEGIEVVKMFNHSEQSYEKYESAIVGFKNHMLSWHKKTMTALNFSMALLPTTLLGIVPVGTILYKNGIISPPEFVLAVVLSMGIVPALLNLVLFVNSSKEIEYALDSCRDLLNIEQLEDSKEIAEINGYDVVFEKVRFGYNEENEVIKGIDLEMKEGEFTALIGPSGSGKSTTAKLIARFWDVSKGEIKIGGTNIKSIPLKQLSDIVSFVTQDNFLFDCSLMDNIRMGNPNATDEEVVRVAKAARCHDFISKLDKGYETEAGEAGNKLSGGEKQRITVARAMLKNAPIVILDEATTYTDPENEYEIQKSVSELAKDKTLIVIAHRLSTIKNADKIVIIDGGKIKEEGTHRSLSNSCEIYRDMWDAHISQEVTTMEGGEICV